MMTHGTTATSTRSRLTAVAAATALVLPFLAVAQTTLTTVESVEDGQTFEVRYTVTFPKSALALGKLAGYDTVRLDGAGCLNEAGQPMLPAQTLRIALPPGMTVTSVRVGEAEFVELAGEYVVYPTQPPRPMSDPDTPEDFVGPDPEIYASPEAYPTKLVELTGQTDLAGQAMACVRVCPIRYVPAEKKLALYTSVEIVLKGVGGYECGDYLPVRISQSSYAAYERMVKGLVVNPADVELRTSGNPLPARGVGPGSYDYVIITQSSWVDDFQPLADWRTKKGVPTDIVTTEWIYDNGGYSGSNLEKVHAFVQDAHANWSTTCFLLGGDSNVIPYHIRTITIPDYWTDDIPNDTYYSDYDEDWVCEVHVSRAPVRTTGQISVFINKVFAYEKNPPLNDYATMAAFLGFDIAEPGDCYGEDSKEYIRGLHLPASWTVNTEYDSEPGTHKADIIGYLNQGHHLVNHHDHCNTDCMGAGWISHSDLLQMSDINALVNGDRQSIVLAVGCLPANFPAYTSVGEALVQLSNGGAVAFIGNTRTGWGGSPSDSDHYSARQDRLFFQSLFDEDIYGLGACFSNLKNGAFEGFDPYNLNMYCFTQLTLLGEPELSIWTEDPQSLTVTHDATLIAGVSTTFPVQVFSDGNPVEQATVCLWKDGDVYEVGQTDELGSAVFDFVAGSTGTLYVTVSKHNTLPYEGEADVVPHYAGDIDGDGDVDLADLATLLGAYGACVGDPDYNPDADLDESGCVDLIDLATLLADYGAGT